jgi:hypothetical protein
MLLDVLSLCRINNFGDLRRATCPRFVGLDLDPTKSGSLFHFPAPDSETPLKLSEGFTSSLTSQNMQEAVQTFTA